MGFGSSQSRLEGREPGVREASQGRGPVIQLWKEDSFRWVFLSRQKLQVVTSWLPEVWWPQPFAPIWSHSSDCHDWPNTPHGLTFWDKCRAHKSSSGFRLWALTGSHWMGAFITSVRKSSHLAVACSYLFKDWTVLFSLMTFLDTQELCQLKSCFGEKATHS